MTSPSNNLVLYDGVCAFCNGAVRFILRIDKKQQFLFASLQGQTAQAVRSRHSQLSSDWDSVVLVLSFKSANERVLERSDAALEIATVVGGIWRLFGVLRFIPKNWRDWIYDFIARHRYQWFGKYDACPLPPPEVRAYFLD